MVETFEKRYYMALGTSVINSPMFPSALVTLKVSKGQHLSLHILLIIDIKVRGFSHSLAQQHWGLLLNLVAVGS